MATETTGLYVDSKTVTTADTPEALTARDILCQAVLIRAKAANTGVVYVVDLATTSKKFPVDGLEPEEYIILPITNPALIKIDVSVNGEGVDWVAV